jgi:hypothetical protein
VLDEWFENEVKPRLKGRSTLVRFAGDAVTAFATSRMPNGFWTFWSKRLARYTRFVDFRSHRPDDKDHPVADGSSFAFLGFCHVLGKVAERQPHGVASNGKETLRPRAGGGHGLVPEQPAQIYS